MKLRLPLLSLLGACAGLSAAAAADTPVAREHQPAPVSVSSANYAQTSREDLLALVYTPTQLNPESRTLAPLDRPLRYVFIPGDLYENDLTYEEICRLVGAALAKKGFINAEDDQRRVVDPTRVDLLLRLHAGERPWRHPLVRTESLTWHDGLVARPRGRTLTTLGGDVAWENRAGGNDDALGAAAANEAAPSFGGFGTGGAAPTTGGAPLSASALTSAGQAQAEYDRTRDFFLIVVDAFDYAEIRQKGDRARRLWTTFVAAPRQPGQKFSEVIATMLKVATPYFGENTRGLQAFNDARARVELGPLKVIESDVPAPKDR